MKDNPQKSKSKESVKEPLKNSSKESVKEYKLKDNTKDRRYEFDLGDAVAFVDYFITPEGAVALTHTDVPYKYENRGIGTQLVSKCLEDIKSKGAHVIPQCPFVAAYIRRHPQWESLIATRYR